MAFKVTSVILSIILIAMVAVACGFDFTLDPQSDESGTESERSAVSVLENSSSTKPETSDASEAVSSTPSEEPSELSEEPSEDVSVSDEIIIPSSITADSIDAFFNDSMFVGNSIMLGYSNYATKLRAGAVSTFLGKSTFFCGGSFGVVNNKNAVTAESTHPTYQGRKYKVQDAVGVIGAKRVFINMMGLNDLALYGNPGKCSQLCCDDVISLIKDIKAKNPGVEVVVLSSTYLVEGSNGMKSLNNENLSKMNILLLDYCTRNNIDFVDISSLLLGDNGCLDDNYCSDNYCHINESGYIVWTAILRNYAARKQAGTYTNPTSMRQLSKSEG